MSEGSRSYAVPTTLGDSASVKWWFRFVSSAIVVFAAIVMAVALMQRHFADSRSEDELDYISDDFELSFDNYIGYGLGLRAKWIRDQVVSATTAVSQVRLRQWADMFDLDEINVVLRDGRIAVSTDDEVAAVGTMLGGPAERFMVLTNGVDALYTEPFRPGAANPGCVRKYLGVPFADGSGYVQVGSDIRHVTESFRSGAGIFMRNWTFGQGRDGFFLCAQKEGDDYRVIMSASRNETGCWAGKLLEADLGFDLDGLYDAFPPSADFHASGVNFCRRSLIVRRNGSEIALRARYIRDILIVAVLPLGPNRDVNQATTVLVVFSLLALFTAFGFLLARISASNRKLSAMRDAENRRNAEDLATAHSIQRTALPVIFPPYPRDLKMDVFARMDPARDVGGDFYDFYYVGENRLAVIVADVSGKGVPAAMFMMKAKTLLKSCVLSKNDLADAVAETNLRLCEGNETEMFVTCWVGVLDEDTGDLVYVNAGHNPPYVRHPDGSLMPVDSVSGLFLGAMDTAAYKVYRTRLAPGDLLFLYTDGVTEANNVMHEMFGESRLEEVLRGERGRGLQRFNPLAPKLAPPQDVCRFVRNAVDAFAGTAAQFDDITMLALRYRGRPEVFEITKPAATGSMPEIAAFAEGKLKDAGCPQDAKSDLLVALDEILTNVCSYSGSADVTLRVELARDPKAARFTVIDSGSAWNPLDHLDPDITLSADEREIGGLGILMVKKLMDDVSYCREDGCNKFSFRKVFG